MRVRCGQPALKLIDKVMQHTVLEREIGALCKVAFGCVDLGHHRLTVRQPIQGPPRSHEARHARAREGHIRKHKVDHIAGFDALTEVPPIHLRRAG